MVAERLVGPDQAYTVRFLAYRPVSGGGCNCIRLERDVGEPLPPAVVEAQEAEGSAARPEYLVVLPGTASLCLRTCPDGLTVRDLRIEASGVVSLMARVEAAAGAPEWMPPVADYAIFHGDRRAAPKTVHVQFVRDKRAPRSVVSVDRLVTALGRSITQANARLAAGQGEGGVALAASVTIRVAVDRFAVSGGGRVLLKPSRSAGPASQQLEITMTTVPGESCAGDP